jgi:hypothetical protein
MTQKSRFGFAVCLCAVFAVSVIMGIAQDKSARPAKPDFVPYPILSPPYPPLPHLFKNISLVHQFQKEVLIALTAMNA